MNLDQVKTALEKQFNEEPAGLAGRTIIFWYDEEKQFVDDIDQLELDNAKLLKLDSNNAFWIKHQLEVADQESNYLIYAPGPKPPARENWLLDINKYSKEFSTDKAVLIMRELGAADPGLVQSFRKYLRFFDNKERYKKFASYGLDTFTAELVDIAVMSALCRLPVVDFEQVLRRVLSGETEKENKYYQAIKNYGDLEAFWQLVEKRYGYHDQEKSLEKLLLAFLVTHLSYNLGEKIPSTWQQLILPKKTDAMLFVNSFINHAGDCVYYEKLARKAEETLKVKEYALKWDLEQFMECETFKVFDEVIIERIKQNLLEGVGEFDRYRRIINERRTNYWFKHFNREYEALCYVVELLAAEKAVGKEIKGERALDLIQAYTEEYYLLDYYYRKFYFYYDQLERKESFAELADRVENTYKQWFLDELSIRWSEAVEGEMQENYPLAGVSQQSSFYNNWVAGHLRDDERVFVIVSDALRYEAGKELLDLLNQEVRGAAQLSYMQGVVPSTTWLGMAALLPHDHLEINEQGDVLIECINAQGTENRGKILKKKVNNALAMQAESLLDMKRADYKEVFEGTKLVYIYHNIIDAFGDDSATERQVFDAVQKTLQQLVQVVRSLVNNISATNIYITADHGFIYRRSSLQESDKVGKFKAGAVAEGRRFVLTDTTEEPENLLAVSMRYLLGKDAGLKAILPKGMIRFKVQGGGANYVHGGVSLQEIVIPLIKYKYLRKEQFRASKVTVKLTNISRKITNRIVFLDFLQTDRVEEKKLPLKLKLYFADDQGNRISNENIIIADSRSEEAQDRKYREKFTLKDIPYDKGKQYFLVMEDEEEAVEKVYERIPFKIDLLISDDFNF